MTAHFAYINSLEALKSLADKLLADGKPVGFDVETGYLGPDRPKGSLDVDWDQQFVCGFSITNDRSWARYVPVAHDHGTNVPEREAWEIIKPVLETLPVIAHNMKFEMRNLRALERKGRGPRIDINVAGDSMLQSYVLSDYQMHNLKYLTEQILGYKQKEIDTLFPGATAKALKALRFNVLELNAEVLSYACDDAIYTLALHDEFDGKVKATRQFIYSLEMHILECLVDMEEAGHEVDWKGIHDAKAVGEPFLAQMVSSARDGLGKMANADLSALNLNSSPQMRKVLYEDLGMTVTRMTKGGKKAGPQPSTDKIALEALSRQYVPVKKILESREVKNLVNRMKKWTTEYNYGWDQRVHASFNQVVVPSGRFSANDPAIQQLPKKWRWTTLLNDKFSVKNDDHWNALINDPRASMGKQYWHGNYRNFLTAAENCYLLGFDYSQIELRCMAGMSQEPALLEAFANGVDVHTLTAAMMLGKPIDQISEDDRAVGKTQNFAILYGMGVKSLAERLALSMDEAQRLYDEYFVKFTKVTAWMNDMKSFGITRGYYETHFKRKATIWDLQSFSKAQRGKGVRLCVNGPVQGTAADYMKISMIRARKVLQEKGWWMTKVRMINNLHDALTFEADNDIDPNELRELLQGAVVWAVPNFPVIVADWEIGQRWGSCTRWKGETAEFIDGVWTVRKEEVEAAPVDDDDDFEFAGIEEPEEGKFVPEPDLDDDDEEIFAQAARHVASVEPEVVKDVALEEIETRPLVVRTQAMPGQAQFGAFLDLLKAHPGKTLVTISTPEGEVDLAKYLTDLTPEAQSRISLMLGGAEVYYESDEVDVEELGEGMSL